MIDIDALSRMVREQVVTTVKEQVEVVLNDDVWLESLEKKILDYSQARIVGKFANATAMPEILEAVKHSVAKLFSEGQVPGIEQFIDSVVIKTCVDQAVENLVQEIVSQFSEDPEWVARVERMINQTITQRAVAKISNIDLHPAIKSCVDEHMLAFRTDMLAKFSSTGIDDKATSCQLTVMDDVTVVENNLTTKDLEVVGTAVIRDLAVKGTININNSSWQHLSDAISEKTLDKLTTEWTDQLISQVKEKIQQDGIEFEKVMIQDEPLVNQNKLSRAITESNLQTVGQLSNLTVKGHARLNDTVHVISRRLGINTDAPEMALSIWDEEVSVVIGKHKSKQAFIGTNRDQGLVIGINREPQIEIDNSGLTTIKQLRIGVHKISHATQVPGWAGTRGDIVFNSNPGPDRVFAWICLGAHRWQTLRSAE